MIRRAVFPLSCSMAFSSYHLRPFCLHIAVGGRGQRGMPRRDGMDEMGRDGIGWNGIGLDGTGRDGMGWNGTGCNGMERDGTGCSGMGRDTLCPNAFPVSYPLSSMHYPGQPPVFWKMQRGPRRRPACVRRTPQRILSPAAGSGQRLVVTGKG